MSVYTNRRTVQPHYSSSNCSGGTGHLGSRVSDGSVHAGGTYNCLYWSTTASTKAFDRSGNGAVFMAAYCFNFFLTTIRLVVAAPGFKSQLRFNPPIKFFTTRRVFKLIGSPSGDLTMEVPTKQCDVIRANINCRRLLVEIKRDHQIPDLQRKIFQNPLMTQNPYVGQGQRWDNFSFWQI